MDDTVLGARSITRGCRRLPAWGKVHANREATGKVIIAIVWLTDSICASNDDVGYARVTGTVGSV
jgi:hypothetical protein